jgi:hypothetical protein
MRPQHLIVTVPAREEADSIRLCLQSVDQAAAEVAHASNEYEQQRYSTILGFVPHGPTLW